MTNGGLMTPSECFRDNVLTRWQSYLSDPAKEWKARDAADAVNSHVEWLFWYYDANDKSRLMGAKDPAQFRRQLCGTCPDLSVVKDVADTAGHRFLRRGGSRSLHSATDTFFEVSGRLYLKSDGRDFLDVLRGVVNFWRRWPD